MARCATIKANGERCGAQAMTGFDQCYVHAPEMAEKRSHTNRRGGKRGGRGRTGPADLRDVQRQVKSVIDGVLGGGIETHVGAVVFQGFNVLLRAIDGELRAREQLELEQRLAEVERLLDLHEGERTAYSA
jgi:hypothetical protein